MSPYHLGSFYRSNTTSLFHLHSDGPLDYNPIDYTEDLVPAISLKPGVKVAVGEMERLLIHMNS